VKQLSARATAIAPFRVMEILARARALEAGGRSIIHMEIGEPDFPMAAPIAAAARVALERGETHYTPALGLPALRAAIAASYPAAARPAFERVVVTPGASGALQLVFALLLEDGAEVLMTDPGYPCYRHLVRLFGGRARLVPVGADSAYQLSADLIRRHWRSATRAVLLASPSNPSGTLIPPAELERIVRTIEELDGTLIVDEIYHGLVYEGEALSALAFSPQVYVVNSFSKYYGMTGWRVGWLVAPTGAVEPLERLAQNMFLAAGTPAQHAALAALGPQAGAELERRRAEFRRRRDYLLPALRRLGFAIPLTPQGAFYLYADCGRFSADSERFCRELLEQAGVAITPGLDFGEHEAGRHVRFSYANTLENLEEGMRRLEAFLR
jgi:aspartate/methionine/tyrosine aminotransferase